MPAERGHGILARRRVDEAGRGERGHRTDGRVDLVPAAARRQLRVRPPRGLRGHARVGHRHGRQQFERLRRGELGDPGGLPLYQAKYAESKENDYAGFHMA